MSALPVDRRARRRAETIEQVLGHAVDVMSEQGVGGLSLGELARRLGVQPPSLYVYFPSKLAVYDALFERAAGELLQNMQAHAADPRPDVPLEQQLLPEARAFVGWALDHPPLAQLLFWRPVPGFEPTPQAYAPAVALLEQGERWFTAARDAGLLSAGAVPEHVLRDWTVLITGVLTQQLSNGPGEGLDDGRFAAALPSLVAMFARHHGVA